MAKYNYRGCDKKADTLVYVRREDKVIKICLAHARTVVNEDNPEYIESCPHCGCIIPVN